jgi:hypothetical protein
MGNSVAYARRHGPTGHRARLARAGHSQLVLFR